MDQYAYIRIAKRVYGKSIRQISRDTGHSRNTIRKVLREEPHGYRRREHQPHNHNITNYSKHALRKSLLLTLSVTPF